ncbi:MAG: gliding motility-associated C-terminal domain-containing protein [Chitinophagaceae bacterium]|nr:gliding motility-associated C-terminal domain-containing protein [Chitinophagaceae bacterium]
MKRFLLVLTSLFLTVSVFANHITGGEVYYVYQGVNSNGDHQYHVTLKLYRDHFSSGAQLDGAAAIAVFATGSGSMVWSNSVTMTKQVRLILGSPGPCINNPPVVDYDVGYYEFDIALPPSIAGYTIAYQRCCRISGINNLSSSSNVGATYTAIIPGNGIVSTGPDNNSAHFIGADTVIVCAGYPFTYSFAAEDLDPTDELSYSFCDAYIGGGQGQGQGPGSAAPNPPAGPTYSFVPYAAPYSGFSPLGGGVTINSSTGLITGIAPLPGIYVVTVCVNEIRNGEIIATQRKDLQIKSGDCDVADANLQLEYIECGGLTLTFQNEAPPNPLINSYYWEFGDPASGVLNTSTDPSPVHPFSAPGEYTIKLVTNRGQECSDSATSTVKVWPGFFPAITSTGVCLINPVQFNDATTTNFGVVDSWRWDFGEPTATNDTSRLQHPSYTYPVVGPKDVRFIVTNSKGCIDTLIQTVNIIDKPPITLAFRDTLICVPDALQLQATGTGTFSWTPLTNIVNPNTGTPTVNPTTTTLYKVQLDDQGCINNDSVLVRVVTFVSLNVRTDTTICLTDSVQLFAVSDGLRYQWTPTADLNDPTLKNPMALPTQPINVYQVVATIGSCSTPGDVTVRTVPYPVVDAGPDQTICFNKPAFLQGTHNGNSHTWSPTSSLLNANTLNPTAFPAKTTEYTLTVHASAGCPKPSSDSITVTVLPKIIPYAGRDTMVIVGQPLQFNAEGGSSYEWFPSTGLNDPFIKNPIGIYAPEIDSVRYTVLVYNEAGCFDSAFIKVTVFKTVPYVFVPTGFTPNGDGLNDLVRPIAVGVKRINTFSIYNRWGQLVFKTTTNGHGWDGRIKGVPQGSNVYVWMVSAVDYLDKPIFLKGTVTLIR